MRFLWIVLKFNLNPGPKKARYPLDIHQSLQGWLLPSLNINISDQDPRPVEYSDNYVMKHKVWINGTRIYDKAAKQINPKQALEWNSQRKGKRGRPRIIWRKTLIKCVFHVACCFHSSSLLCSFQV